MSHRLCGKALGRAVRRGGTMRAGAAVAATLGGAFMAGAAARVLVSRQLEGTAMWAAAVLLLATAALAVVGLRAFHHRARRRGTGR